MLYFDCIVVKIIFFEIIYIYLNNNRVLILLEVIVLYRNVVNLCG